MNVFELRNQLISDYDSYVRSFIRIRDKKISAYVQQSLDEGLLWPDPLIQLNPAFEPGATIETLIDRGVLHQECQSIFCRKTAFGKVERNLSLHRHQSDAIERATSGKSYVLTTGTGSGKSLTYIIPIVDHVLKRGSGRGIQAIVVYPMNALANSQEEELKRFLNYGYPAGKSPVTFARYTGQESEETRRKICSSPPDILLTNYVMLEYILTRPREKDLVRGAQGLRFLVLDELHTYRGRQGADVALLIRRVREAMDAPDLQCVGTSATLASTGTFDEQRHKIAEVASTLFGATVEPDCVIGETLRRTTPETDLNDPDFKRALTARVADDTRKPSPIFAEFVSDPLSIWIESVFGVTKDSEGQRLIRCKPIGIGKVTSNGAQQPEPKGAVFLLAELTGLPLERCIEAIQEALLAGYACENPETGFAAFAFRLHQFISKGDTVYTSLEPEASRYMTVYGQKFVPGDRSRTLLPLVFCRECGQEYYSVRKGNDDDEYAQVNARPFTEQYDDDKGEAGFLYYSTDNPWSDNANEILDRLPDDFVEAGEDGKVLRKEQVKNLPTPLYLTQSGLITDANAADIKVHFLESPFRFCLNCGVSYAPNQDDFAKLSPLASEGRSTATTILSLSAIRRLRAQPGLEDAARKLLSFTDNRQDASLQAGHFNDFIEIGLLRSAILAAAEKAGSDGIGYDELPKRVFDALNLPKELYAQDPTVQFNAEKELQRAFRNVLAYRLYRDLKRGWRVTSPNLEQCGLLEIRYESLEELCHSEEHWQGVHLALVTASPETRLKIARTLLDYMRRELAVKVDYLDPIEQERIKEQSRQKLIEPWEIDDTEKMETSCLLFPRARSRTEGRENVYVSSRGGYGRYLRRHDIIPGSVLKQPDIDHIIPQLLTILSQAGLVEKVTELPDKTPGYQLPASAMRWHAAEGITPFLDPIRVPSSSQGGGGTNRFFVAFYKQIAKTLVRMKAKEHTAQVPPGERIERERLFRTAELPILYCSPTMELGVDISTLNVVNMRNVPPTPANYAQRSGRAGRNGQPALVFTYCTTGSPHDQYFFKRADLMVYGAVNPPHLELANEDLVRAHVHAIWLAEAGLPLGDSLKEVLELPSTPQALSDMPVKAEVQQRLTDEEARSRAFERAAKVLASFQNELETSDWYAETWLEDTLKQILISFEAACHRWRDLYLSASKQQVTQNAIVMDASRSSRDKEIAKRLRGEAEEQRKLLLDIENRAQSDFYSYRYFASEGFLPGYNFPRLPLSAYIPARNSRQKKDDFLSRPRFLAISEFGPGAIIYHEGARYEVTKVILPVGERNAGEQVITRQAKLCPQCGYLHPITVGVAYDNCERCYTQLDQPISNLFRLQNVVTRRRQRINSDEEERMRRGYELLTGVRFEDRGAGPSYQRATLEASGEIVADLAYGQSATLWRINLGWRRRKEKEQHGFVLDIERGAWVADKKDKKPEDDLQDPTSNRVQRVVPYVEDRRNCMLLTPKTEVSKPMMASLASALKSAIQVVYSLEDNELAVEPLPSEQRRQHLVFYESAEGGAGVLRQLFADRFAMAYVAREALSLCHFDPDTGEDLGKPPRLKEICTAACYNCLLSYGNQRDHEYLDRFAIRDLLLRYANATLPASPTTVSRSQHLEGLITACESDLERRWLQYLEANGYRLPTHTQRPIPECGTRPDFMYLDTSRQVVIYVDGPPHDNLQRQERDVAQTDCMRDVGYTVIRFRYDHDWDKTIARYPSIFGVKS